ncbi:Ig-like domain-containing protein [Pseudoalteromonas sp. MMG005]|uniref:tandem-95 repeat protein n=1 Tax=Pseudoalteromonas sp. MMG005 TaxID=2822682 RepID=UPI001B39E0F1|nr:Ig-like domain-containing protein [Pseudoalteromonas sp. MMG005]MBQ4845481.1 tandem-95 repeat protein [Pseudoalteromonas sp. MMG005]
MTIKRWEWLAALFARPYAFTYAKTKNKVNTTIPTLLAALCVLFFTQSAKAIECHNVYVEGFQLRCANYSMVNNNLFSVTYHQADSSSNTAQLVYVSNPGYIVEEVPQYVTKGETYTLTNNLSTQSPKQTITITWREGSTNGFDVPILSHNPNTDAEFHLSSKQLHINDYQGLDVISEAPYHSIRLEDNAYDNHLFKLEYGSRIRFNDQPNITLGEYKISVTFENLNEPSLNVTKQFTIEVVDHVTLSGRPKSSVYQNQTYSFSPTISHSDHLDPNEYSFHIENKPTWATFDTRLGMLQGTPTEDDLGATEEIHIYVTDGKARYLVEPFTITVLPFNYSQKVNYLHYNSLYTGREFSLFPHHIENTDNDPLTYQLLKAPQWMEVNPASGELFGIPEANSDIDLLETETIDVTIAVSDGENTYQTSHTLYITKLDDAELILPLTGNLSYSSSTYNFDIDESQGLLSHFNISNELKDRLSVTVINADLLCQNHGLLVGSNGVIILNNYSNNTFTCQFQFIIQDFNQASKVHTANLTFTPGSVPPLINWDSVFIEEDQTTTIDVLANDVIGDKSSAKSTLKITSAPQLGDAEVIDGQIKYTPHPNMFGQDTLSYSFDSPFHGVTGPVTIDINFNNDVPTVTPHTAQLIEDDVSQSISLRALASDIEDGVPAGAISIISSPTKGAMSFNLQDESIVYTPRANETGIDTLSFTVTDNFGAVSEPGIITFDIEAVNDTPIAQSDTLNTLEDTVKELNILENDSDIEDETFTAENITLEDQGQGAGIYPLANVTVTPAGNLLVNPTPNASGTFSFTYMVTDSGGNTSQPATVNVLIEAVNDVPSADSKKVEAIEEQPIAITLTASDIEQSPLTYKIISVPKSGNLTIINDVVTYTGNLNFSGADSFTYAAFDQTSWSTPATVNINVANVQDLPLISGSPATNVKQGQLYDFTPTASDVDNDALSFTINNMPSWLSFNASTGQLVGTPSNDDVNTYTNIAIKVFDGTGYTALTPFSIEVINVNDAPTLTGTPAASINEDALYSFTPSLTDVDLDDSHTFSIENAPMWATFNTTSGVLSGTPTNKHVGSTDNVIISVTDKAGEKATLPAFNITVKNVNDAPQLTGTPSSSVAQDSTYTFTPTLTDVDKSDSHTFAIQNRPEWATFNTESGTLTGTPLNKHVGGTENITISVTDKAGEKATLPAFDITVENINDAPQLTGVPSSNVAQDSVYTFTPTLVDVDKSDSHTFAILNKPEWASFNSESGTLTGTPLNKHVGSTDNIIISVTDKAGEKATLPTFSITVSNTNDAPQLTGTPPSSVAQDSAYTFTPALSDIDVDDSHTFAIQNRPEWATFNTESGTLNGTPLNEHVGRSDNIIISVADKGGATATLPAFAIEVTNINDAPALTGAPLLEVEQNNIYNFEPTLTDPDLEDIHTFSIENKPTWITFDEISGALTGIPVDNDVGTFENIIISVKDNVAGSLSVSLAPFSITVINSPDIPSAEPFQFTLNEGEALTIGKVNGLLSTATDVDLDSGDTLIAILRESVKYGTLTLNESGAFIYEHDGSETLEDTFTYRVKDSTNLVSTTQTVTLTINPIDDAPIAKNDEASTQEDTPVTFSLIDNDTDAEQKLVAASARLVTEPKFGSVSIINGSATYTPNKHANGPDSFTYTVSDSTPLTSEPATVNIAVAAVNDAPKAVNISKMTDEDTDLVISIDDIRTQASDIEDTNPTGDVKLTSEPTHGAVTLNQADGTLTYIPNLNVVATDTFKYTIADSNEEVSNEATISINIGAINDRPVVENDSAQTDEDTPLTLDILHNDSDVEDQGFNGANITLEDQGKGEGVFDLASVTVNADGQLHIAPAKDAVGELTFTYVLTDSEALASVPATVKVTIKPVNDAPVAENNTATVQEDGSFEINILGNDTDVDANDKLDVASVTLTDAASSGTVVISATGTATYTPNENFSGSDSFTYTIKDIAGAISNKAEVLVTVEAVNDAPVATPSAMTVVEDGSIDITLTGTDIEKSALTYKISTTPSNGVLTPVSGAVWSYTPTANFNGTDSIAFIANDGELDSAPAQIAITITAINDAPNAQNVSATTDEETPISITLNGSDIDGDNLSFIIINQPSNGSATLSGGQVNYIPNDDFTGTDSFNYQANDGSLTSNSAVANIQINNVNDAPNITGTPATTVRQGNTYTFTPSATDIDSTQLSYIIVNKPIWANFDSTTGTLSGTPARGDVGTSNNISITVSDQELTASLPAFAIEVSFTNTPPRAQAQTISVQEDGTTSFIPAINDIDGDALNVEIVTQPNAGTASVQGNTLTYTPNANYNGEDTLTYIVDDGTDKSSEARIAINVVSVNDMPQANPDTFTFDGNDANRYVLDVLSNDTDLDEQPLTIVGAQTSIGSVVVENNQLVYQAPTQASTTVTIHYVIVDPEQARSASSATLNITSQQTGLPVIAAPADISVDATGLFTKVELGIATATDSQGNTLAVSLVTNKRIFTPGKHLVYWQTQDSKARMAMASHTVTVNPIVSIDQGFTVSEGSSNTISVQLNGDAPSYPVTIPYTVSGSASAADHTLENGEIVIASGRSGLITFDVIQDDLQEKGEAILITLGNEVNANSSSNTATISIEEGNIAPQITTTISQQGENRTLVAADQGEVSLLATVSDANADDVLQVSWASTDPRLHNTSGTDKEFTFSPEKLPAGNYTITASVTDNATPALTTSQDVYFEIIAQLATLTSQDSDGDMIPDNEEGYADSDGDGIPDYLDAISQLNVLQGSAGNSTAHLIEAQPGTSLRKGTSVAQNSSGGAQLLSSELPSDDTAQNVGGLYDFIASGLMNAGDVFTIVLPQYEQVPLNAIYRKYKNGEWVNFTLGDGNTVMSAQGESGYCPAASSSQWHEGLNPGHWCIKLQIVDGGPNDDDGLANKSVVDPSGMAIVLNGNSLPVTTEDTFTVTAGKRTQLDVLSNDSDADGDVLSIVNVTSDIGTVELNGNDIYFTPPNNFAGLAQLTYMIGDTQGGSATGHASITIVMNSAPIATRDTASTKDNQTLEIDVLANDHDVDGDTLTVTAASVDEGSVRITSGNTLSFVPTKGFAGNATILYTISDNAGATANGEVIVTVTLSPTETPTKPTPDTLPEKVKKSSGSFNLLLLILLSLIMRRNKHLF